MPITRNLLASVPMVVSLPRGQLHDFSAHLNHFTQPIGPAIADPRHALSFRTLGLEGNVESVDIRASTRCPDVTEFTELIVVHHIEVGLVIVKRALVVDETRISRSPSLWSK